MGQPFLHGSSLCYIAALATEYETSKGKENEMDGRKQLSHRRKQSLLITAAGIKSPSFVMS
jgi:hypothetical protein